MLILPITAAKISLLLFIFLIFFTFLTGKTIKFSNYIVLNSLIGEKSSVVIPLNFMDFKMSFITFHDRYFIYYKFCCMITNLDLVSCVSKSIFSCITNFLKYLSVSFILIYFFFFLNLIKISREKHDDYLDFSIKLKNIEILFEIFKNSSCYSYCILKTTEIDNLINLNVRYYKPEKHIIKNLEKHGIIIYV